MSFYQFTPQYAFGTASEPFVHWNDGFSSDEIDEIIKVGESLDTEDARVGIPKDNPDIAPEDLRKTKLSWIEHQHAPWLYDRLAWIMNQLNGQFYKFDITGFNEHLQFGIYDKDDHYDWHIDAGPSVGSDNIDARAPRKLSLCMQLSDPDDYEGGELEIMTANRGAAIAKTRGLITVFPSYTLHRVRPVTKGIRKSLVVWASGPQFR